MCCLQISDSLVAVSHPEQLKLLETLEELVCLFRKLTNSSRVSLDARVHFMDVLWCYYWGQWVSGRLNDAHGTGIEGAQYIRSHTTKSVPAFAGKSPEWLAAQALVLFDLGRIPDAITAAHEAYSTYQEEIDTQSYLGFDCFPPLILAIILRQTGRESEALWLLEDATSPDKCWAQGDWTAFHFLLAELAVIYVELEHFQLALRAAKTAVAACRDRLYKWDDCESGSTSSYYKLALAYALTALSKCLSGHRSEESLLAAEEAARLCRQVMPLLGRVVAWLTGLRPQEITASALETYSIQLSTSGEYYKALANAEQATNLHRELVLMAERYLPSLANSLQNFASILWEMGRREDSIIALEEAVQIRSRLASVGSEQYLTAPLEHALGQLEKCILITKHSE
ncbi:hypothetical protein B0H17DRAFT_1131359 [Mycena rosella]|uniref:Uncharacterized protein n=1 Tax=Mycena rosella TaxID=1033263 RepID=A0AAD7DQE3_MYCRO|nr:hypothetical protein B0H17DRAFT_1131359 [Mycena rosella]